MQSMMHNGWRLPLEMLSDQQSFVVSYDQIPFLINDKLLVESILQAELSN